MPKSTALNSSADLSARAPESHNIQTGNIDDLATTQPSQKFIRQKDSLYNFSLAQVEDIEDIAEKKIRIVGDETAKDIRRDIMAVFGIFAGFLIFATTQIQIFTHKDMTPVLAIGLSAFFVGSLLTFVLALKSILHNENNWKFLKHPALIGILLMFAISFVCIYFTLNDRGITGPVEGDRLHYEEWEDK